MEFGGPETERGQRLEQMRSLTYNDLSADRNTVAVVQAMEAILGHHAQGRPGATVEVNAAEGVLVLRLPGTAQRDILYPGRV